VGDEAGFPLHPLLGGAHFCLMRMHVRRVVTQSPHTPMCLCVCTHTHRGPAVDENEVMSDDTEADFGAQQQEGSESSLALSDIASSEVRAGSAEGSR